LAGAACTSSTDKPTVPRAVIVDQLGLTDPNAEFVQRTIAIFVEHGYEVEYYAWDKVTVDLYRRLPEKHYDFIILRSHSSGQTTQLDEQTGEKRTTADVTIFTNERFDPASHQGEFESGAVGRAFYPQLGSDAAYFSLTRSFVQEEMQGEFDGATIILMGCGGLQDEKMARAFIDRGAGYFISWDEEVTASHTDDATSVLLDRIVIDRVEPSDAASETMTEVGPDPEFGSRLHVVSS
jgi:hypothetical protein